MIASAPSVATRLGRGRGRVDNRVGVAAAAASQVARTLCVAAPSSPHPVRRVGGLNAALRRDNVKDLGE